MIPAVTDSATTAGGGLDPEQRAAVTAPAGPVCILAGAGTGKTRAITHRIAHRVQRGEIHPKHVLAVTFTARAAAEMRARLGQLDAPGVQARTFHAAALRQLRYFAPRLFAGRDLPELLESKARLVGLAAARVGLRTDRSIARDLAAEIEWAKSSLVEPAEYVVAAAKARREPPFEPAKVGDAYAAYEQMKRAGGAIDFEDMLRAAAWAIEEHEDVAEQVRTQYRHFVVDEYQDVNPLQQRLLEAWLGDRDDLTVVGDASQTIYSFTGASSSYLLDFPRRRRGATVVRLVRDYRSTPQVVGLANAVIAQARGELAKLRLELVGQRPSGPEPEIRVLRRRVGRGRRGRRPLRRADRRRGARPGDRRAVPGQCAVRGLRGGAGRGRRALRRLRGRALLRADRGAPGDGRAARRDPQRACRHAAAGGGRRGARGGRLAARRRAAGGGAARERWEAVAALVTLADEAPRAVARGVRRGVAAAGGGPARARPSRG